MRGASAGSPGEVEIIEFPEPELGDGEVILSPLACGICTTDVKFVMKGSTGTRYALGHELAGVITEASPSSGWTTGKKVIAAPYLPCGACYYCLHNQPTLCTDLYESSPIPGALAERVKIPRDLAQRGLFEIPDSLDPVTASLSEPLGCVIQGLEACRFTQGSSLLVVGDGPMGIITAAAARAWGAYPVIVAGMMEHRLEIASRHYADFVIDITREDLAAKVKSLTGGRGADVVMVAVSSGEALEAGIQCVRPGGAVNSFAGVPDGTIINLDVRKLHYKQYFLTGSSGVAPVHLRQALDLLSSCRIEIDPLITARFSFDATAEAVAYAAGRVGLKAVVIF